MSHVCICAYVDLRSVLPALAKHLAGFLDPVEHATSTVASVSSSPVARAR